MDVRFPHVNSGGVGGTTMPSRAVPDAIALLVFKGGILGYVLN